MQDVLQQKITAVITQLQSTAPKAAELALEATKADAVASFIDGGLALVVLGGVVWVWKKKLLPKFADDDYDIPEVVAGAVTAILGLICVILVMSTLLDPWTYIAFARPELWLAHQIICAAGK